MTTLSAVPNTNGSVTLTITPSTAVVAIVRKDNNGTADVRLTSGVLPHSSGVLEVTDHEPALAGVIEYRVDDGGEGDNAWVTMPGGLPRFSIPHAPHYSIPVETVTAYDAQSTSRTTVHPIIGRPDPIVVQGQLSTRRGRLAVYCREYNDARNLYAMFAKGRTCHYRQAEHPGMDMYFYPENIGLIPTTANGQRSRWQLDVTYIEVRNPSGDITARPGWSFDALTADAEDFNEVANDYANFIDLANGEAIL